MRAHFTVKNIQRTHQRRSACILLITTCHVCFVELGKWELIIKILCGAYYILYTNEIWKHGLGGEWFACLLYLFFFLFFFLNVDSPWGCETVLIRWNFETCRAQSTGMKHNTPKHAMPWIHVLTSLTCFFSNEGLSLFKA